DGRVRADPDASVATGGIGRPVHLLLPLTRVVAQQVVALPAVDGVEDDLVADVVEHLREDPRRGPGQDRAGGRGRELLGRRRVGVQDVEVAACAEREGAGDRRDPGGATGRPTGRFDQRRHQNPTVTFRKMPRLGGYGAMSMLERIAVEPKFETSGSSPEY